MSSAAKVGILMIVILAITGFFILKIQDISLDRDPNARTIEAVFDSVAGLDEGSPVRVAGVRVGKVSKIELQPDGRAKVTIALDKDVALRQGASASVTNLGLLGEKYVELSPGPMANPPIPHDQRVVLNGTVPASIDQVTSQVSAIAEDVKAITESLRAAVGGPAGEQRLTDIVENVRVITEQVRLLIAANEGNVNATASNLREITADLRVEIPRIARSIEQFADSLNGTVGENREDVRALVANLKTLSGDLKTTADNVNAITGQVRSGEGTVGKLLYDPKTAESLTNTIAQVESGVGELRDMLGRVGKMRLEVGMRADYLAGLDDTETPRFEGNSRSAVTLGIFPNPARNRFYNIELVDDPIGSIKEKIVETTVTTPSGGTETIFEREKKYERDFLITAQAGWQLDDLALRVGLIDSTGGIGADYKLNERLRVSGEAFDFGDRRGDNPHLRVYGRYTIRKEKPTTPLLFVSTGVDNPLNDTVFMFGGGIRWTDDDLKYLLGSVPLGN